MTPTPPQLDAGHAYTRAEISKLLGGGIQIYLPNKDGKVVAGCFDVSKGPYAPREILVGEGPGY